MMFSVYSVKMVFLFPTNMKLPKNYLLPKNTPKNGISGIPASLKKMMLILEKMIWAS